MLKSFLHRPFFIRLFHWEYWSFAAIYIWTTPAWLYYCLRSRSFFFFTASNPSIPNGGLVGESKKDIHRILPQELIPPTMHFSMGTSPELVVDRVSASAMQYPLIGKPDIGGKGRGVRILHNPDDVRNYASVAELDFHIQQFVPYTEEAGIFYFRYPDQDNGEISGIVGKEFLTVTGNGKDSLRVLIRAHKRGIMYIRSLEAMHKESLGEILEAGATRIVSPFGNHARGSKFLDHSDRIDPQVTAMIDALSKRIPGFYFGRFDIRFSSWEEFRQGKNFCIIELNGAGAEPTHIYDPRHSLFFAWKEIIRHWGIMCRISMINHRRGVPYPSFREGVRIFRQDKEDAKKLERMSD